MQQFCWNICYDSGIKEKGFLQQKVDPAFDIFRIFNEVAEDSGFPIYDKLAKGPQSRTERIMRPLVKGGAADIYQAILLAIAATGPKEKLTYDQIRSSLNQVLSDKVPQKLEVSNALNHLASIDREQNRGERAIDWDGDSLDLVITDPFFRFYPAHQAAPPAFPILPHHKLALAMLVQREADLTHDLDRERRVVRGVALGV